MLIDDFCKEMAHRYPHALKTAGQLEAYSSDAQLVLKNFQGEILGYAFNIIREDLTRLPKIPEVKAICLKVRLDQEPNKKIEKKAPSFFDTDVMINQFFQSPMGQECLRRGIGNQAKDFIEKEHFYPKTQDCNRFLKVEKETAYLVRGLQRSNGDDPVAGLRKTISKIAEQFKIKERKLKEKYLLSEVIDVENC